ncbi:HalOD1 output domain-containing protein [Halosolutus gelatinilyticus]|uniref:HalOD1 output domain-containing protein n=1 Tax=Halosolutus gelatinilyticus TaxID=2931975 RepID=UPI003CE4B1F0
MPTCRPPSDERSRLLTRIVAEVAGVRDRPPEPESRPLYDIVDPEALERVVRSAADASLEIRFEYDGCTVTIDADGRVTADRTVRRRRLAPLRLDPIARRWKQRIERRVRRAPPSSKSTESSVVRAEKCESQTGSRTRRRRSTNTPKNGAE